MKKIDMYRGTQDLRQAAIRDRIDNSVARANKPPLPIHNLEDLEFIADVLKLRSNWHEPDEKGVGAQVFGKSFDNAGFWTGELNPYSNGNEMHVVLYLEYDPAFSVNLATLFAWATGHEDE